MKEIIRMPRDIIQCGKISLFGYKIPDRNEYKNTVYWINDELYKEYKYAVIVKSVFLIFSIEKLYIFKDKKEMISTLGEQTTIIKPKWSFNIKNIFKKKKAK